MHATLAVVALLQANLDVLHLRTATDSHITTSRALWPEHVLVVPAIKNDYLNKMNRKAQVLVLLPLTPFPDDGVWRALKPWRVFDFEGGAY